MVATAAEAKTAKALSATHAVAATGVATAFA